tara:strand:+ start:12 stop:881 length:870 start_codon:yes stop_codon:yes gene_type:complete
MIASFAVLAIVFLTPDMATNPQIDFETILPIAIANFIPSGLKGLLLAGLMAAFMGTFAAVINAAPAYIANDLLKNSLLPGKTEKTYVRFGYLSSFLLVVIGVFFGFFADSLNAITLWITASLYGGYTAANVLKWVWWRFNGYGYFWGMLAGLLASTIKLIFFVDWIDIYFFPIIFAFSILGCIMGSYFSSPDNIEVLKSFYKNVNPWGFWKPVLFEVQKDDPTFLPNRMFGRDMFNVMTGIIWQMALVVWPIFLMIKKWDALALSLTVVAITSILLKYFWYDPLKKEVY